jgi:crotonobetaine/carnitine-CoA ligase
VTRSPKVPQQETLLQAFSALPGKPDETFIEFEMPSMRLTWGEFDTRVRRVAAGLAELGVRPGDRVAGLLDNGPALIETWFATLAIGAVWVPINTALRGSFLSHVLADCAAGVLVAEADQLDLVFAVWDDIPDLHYVVSVDDIGRPARAEIPPGRGAFVRSIRELRDAPAVRQVFAAQPGDLACLVYTSGTTGVSKGCMLPHNYLMSLSRQGLFDRRADEPVFTSLPLYHLNAMTSVILTLVLGSRAMIGRRFSVSRFWPLVEQSGAKFVNLLGPMAMMLANAPDDDAMRRCKGQLRRVLSAPFPEHAQRVFRERFGVQEVNPGGGYGMTEAALLTANPDWEPLPPGSTGRRWHMFDVRIVDDADRELPAGAVGEVVCRPNYPNIMFQGYWRRPAATLEAFRNLWFHTGDLGRFDDNDCFFFVDRKKDYIRRRGENISSMELENVLQQHPEVDEVAAYGVPSELGEDEVQVSIVRRPGSLLSAEALCEWAVERLPHFAVPRYIEFVAALPRSATGRVRKVELRSRTEAYPRWDREDSSVDIRRRR